MTRRKIIAAGALATALVATAVFGFWSSEPSARGRSLSAWLKLAAEPDYNRAPEFAGHVPEAAIREIGRKAIPFLLDRLRATESQWKRRAYELINQQKYFRFEYDWPHQKQSEAVTGFSILGTNALSALPELEKLFWQSNSTWNAGICLGYLGTNALPILRSAVTNSNSRTRLAAALGISLMPLPPEQMVAELMPWRFDQDDGAAWQAIRTSLAVSSSEPRTALAIEALESGRPLIQAAVLVQIETLSVETNAVVPIITRLLRSNDLRCRQQATNALRKMDPAAAFAAGVDTNRPPPRTGPGGNGRRLSSTNTPPTSTRTNAAQ